MEIVKDLDDGMLDAFSKKLPPGHHYLLLKKAKEIHEKEKLLYEWYL
jgi:hypothetical protein